MTADVQHIPLPLPEYLARYLAYKLNQPPIELKDKIVIPTDRHSFFGKRILNSLEKISKPIQGETRFALQVSNWSANNYYDIPKGKFYFLGINPSKMEALQEIIKEDFDEALILFVKGAEFAHLVNGWNPRQKRKGIRKKAILEFCKILGVDIEERTLESLFKMYQRHGKPKKKRRQKSTRKFSQLLSF